jgi:1,2-diacylglycerol 3-alpha-glucosyltransferase
MKIIICYTHITPRHIRRIQCLAERVPELIALEIADSENVYPWWQGKYEIGFVRQERLCQGCLEDIPQAVIIKAAKQFLEREKPDIAVVADYSRPSMRFIARWVKRNGGKTILPAVSCAEDTRRFFLREMVKGFILRQLFDAVCAAGERTQRYFKSLGFSQERIWKQFNVIENDHFLLGSKQAKDAQYLIREKLHLPQKYFLFVGALEPWKNSFYLLDSYINYRRSGGQWGLVFVGTGSQLIALQQKVKSEQILDVIFAGMQNYKVLPSFYGLASCFIIPSLSEPWGLVVNEAEAAGLPILASNKCGCIPELVHRGINGYIFNPTDKHELTRLMCLMSGGSLNLEVMGQSSRQIIQYYTPERWADALVDSINYCNQRRCKEA